MADAGQTSLIPVRRATEIVAGLRLRWNSIPAGRRASVSAGGFVVIVAALGLAWYASRPDWRMLFSGLEGRDVALVSQELAAAGIPFQTTATGTGVEVPAESLDKARMEVAAKGMPQSGRLGFELFDKPNWVGSEFDERVNYQRALEGELEHTIGTLDVVRSARVHLVLPQASVFLGDQKVAKASVVLRLKRASLAQGQADSIRGLVAGAVETLNPDQVTLVDADGRVSFESKNQFAMGGTDEQTLEARLIAMLEPLAGVGNVRATVNVTYEQGTEERTDETYDPAQSATLSSHRSEQTNSSLKPAQGVPGTASNTPAAAPAGAVQGSDRAAVPGSPPLLQQKGQLPVFPQNGTGSGASVKEESGTFAVSKHLRHTEEGPGRVSRVTAAVVVNDRLSVEGAGKTEHPVWKPRTTEEMHRLESLAQAAVGYDTKRGDEVVLQNVSFTSNMPEAKVAASQKFLEDTKMILATQPSIFRTAMLGMVGLLLIWFVLKPIAGHLTVAPRVPLMLVGKGLPSSDEVSIEAPSRSQPGVRKRQDQIPANQDQTEQESEFSRKGSLEDLTRQIRRQPSQSARLLESWITAEGESE